MTSSEEWIEWTTPAIWGAKVEIRTDFIEKIRGSVLSDDDASLIHNAVIEYEKEVHDVALSSLGIGIELNGFDWTTSIDFGHEYDGGGYYFSFGHEDICDRYGLPTPLMVISVESDSYSDEAGYERGLDTCLNIVTDLLREFLLVL